MREGPKIGELTHDAERQLIADQLREGRGGRETLELGPFKRRLSEVRCALQYDEREYMRVTRLMYLNDVEDLVEEIERLREEVAYLRGVSDNLTYGGNS